jgi:hypothetical protein
MAAYVDRFNTIALIERFNHVGRVQECDYAGIATNIPFRVLYVSIVEGGRIVLSLMMGDTLGQVILPPRFLNIFNSADLYRINDDRVRLCLLIRQSGGGPRYLELSFLEE